MTYLYAYIYSIANKTMYTNIAKSYTYACVCCFKYIGVLKTTYICHKRSLPVAAVEASKCFGWYYLWEALKIQQQKQT